MAFFSPLGPEDHNAADNELNDAAKQTTTSAQDFIYPPLDMSRSEFRILTLPPGHCDDEINARLQTAYMLALPLSLEDGLHHVQLHEIYEALSSAVGEGTEVQFDELLRWQRLHGELNELYTWGYEAISYYCGDQSVKKRIKLNDVAVEVPATAADALRGLRRNDRERVLWIDALCIDQGNATERAHQVLQLSRIYSSARRTLVWLGDEDETATETLTSALKDLQQSARNQGPKPESAELLFTHNNASIYRSPKPTSADIRPSCIDGEPREQNFPNPLEALLEGYLNRPWFSRLWTFQEVLLSQQCVCCIGSHELNWSLVQEAFKHAYRWTAKTRQTRKLNVGKLVPASPWMRTAFAVQTSAVDAGQLSLRHLLVETIPLDCFDARDKVYAVLGLTRWSRERRSFPREIWPDYTKTVVACMSDATVAVIREDASLDCLSLRTFTGSKPTWVVPWHQLGNDLSVPTYVRLRRRCKSSSDEDCSNRKPLDYDNMMQSSAPGSLFLRGYRFRRAGATSDVASSEVVQELSLLSKLRMIMERIDDVTGGEVAFIQPHAVFSTIGWDVGEIAETDYQRQDCEVFVMPNQSDTDMPDDCHALEYGHMLPLGQQDSGQAEHDKQDEIQAVDIGQGGPISVGVNQECADSELDGQSRNRHDKGKAGRKAPRRVEDLLDIARQFRIRLKNVWGMIKHLQTTWNSGRSLDASAGSKSLRVFEDWPEDARQSGIRLENMGKMIKHLQTTWNSGRSLGAFLSDQPGLEESEDYSLIHARLDECLTQSRFYTPLPDWTKTEPVRASFGIGPKEMEPGDQVVILFGSRQPVILRPEQSSWLYIGSAYAHEMMDEKFVRAREYLQELEPNNGWESEVFEIQ